jgi:hypothetical protein
MAKVEARLIIDAPDENLSLTELLEAEPYASQWRRVISCLNSSTSEEKPWQQSDEAITGRLAALVTMLVRKSKQSGPLSGNMIKV